MLDNLRSNRVPPEPPLEHEQPVTCAAGPTKDVVRSYENLDFKDYIENPRFLVKTRGLK